MRLVALQRFDFSAAHRLRGPGIESRLHGHNFSLWVGLTGPLPDTGVVVARADFARRVNAVLERYDHRDLNAAMKEVEPTPTNMVRGLWSDLAPGWPGPLALESLTLLDEGGPGASLGPEGASTIVTGEFSAAHRAHAPRLSEADNLALYGTSHNPAGHGHNYRAEVVLPPDAAAPPAVWAEFDHKNLSADLPDLRGRNVVTEAIAELLARRIPLARRVRVWETAAFFAEYEPPGVRYRLGRRYRFNAAHHPHDPRLSAEDNRRLYGPCGGPGVHGHTYTVEARVAGPLDPRTETAGDLGRLDQMTGDILSELDYTELEARLGRPATGEALAAYLWSRLTRPLAPALECVSVWETPARQYQALSRRPDF
jgi:6-pyruvoyltetrahydropterin/6-carboxytetrahydropterin synthase